jgi:hypothetical protein
LLIKPPIKAFFTLYYAHFYVFLSALLSPLKNALFQKNSRLNRALEKNCPHFLIKNGTVGAEPEKPNARKIHG